MGEFLEKASSFKKFLWSAPTFKDFHRAPLLAWKDHFTPTSNRPTVALALHHRPTSPLLCQGRWRGGGPWANVSPWLLAPPHVGWLQPQIAARPPSFLAHDRRWGHTRHGTSFLAHDRRRGGLATTTRTRGPPLPHSSPVIDSIKVNQRKMWLGLAWPMTKVTNGRVTQGKTIIYENKALYGNFWKPRCFVGIFQN